MKTNLDGKNPNKDVGIVLTDELGADSNEMFNAIEQMDLSETSRIMREMLLKCSCHDLRTENSYHIFYYGIFLTIFNDKNLYEAISNSEEGKGRYNIKLLLKQKKKMFINRIYEIKTSR